MFLLNILLRGLEEGKDESLSLVWDSQPVEMGSLVGVESIREYPHHYGSGHTQLLSPATITENGVELGCVTGWPITGEHLAHNIFDMELDGTHTPLPGSKDISDSDNINISIRHIY